MSAIPERVWELLTNDEQENLRAIIDGWRYSPVVMCPECNAKLGVRLKVTAGAVSLDNRTIPDPAVKTPVVVEKAADMRIIEEATASGMLAAFEEAVRQGKPQSQPSDIGQHLLTFFRTYGEKIVPREVLARYMDEFPGCRLDFWSAQGVIAVLADRQVRAFIPSHLVFGAPVRDARGIKRGVLGTDQQRFDVWVKGKHGYVPAGASIFADVMRRRSVGDFADVTQ